MKKEMIVVGLIVILLNLVLVVASADDVVISNQIICDEEGDVTASQITSCVLAGDELNKRRTEFGEDFSTFDIKSSTDSLTFENKISIYVLEDQALIINGLFLSDDLIDIIEEILSDNKILSKVVVPEDVLDDDLKALLIEEFETKEALNKLNEYSTSIDYSCNQVSDCKIKDVHSCCGYYPKCTNKNANTDADLVRDLCKAEGVSGSCGYSSINYCECKDGRCVGGSNVSRCATVECNLVKCEDGCELDSAGCLTGKCNVNDDVNKSECPKLTSLLCEEGTKEEKYIGDDSCEKSKCVLMCPSIGRPNCPPETEVDSDRDSNDCIIRYKCNKRLSNGRNAEVKIMPETASEKAIERLGELNFTVELKEVGKGDSLKAVYELTGKKNGKFLGIFKIIARVQIQVDAESGEVVKVIKPWWSFLAGI